MPMDAGTLFNAILPVCPVESTQVIDGYDRGTWSFVPGPGATQPQIDAGNNIIATIPIDPKKPLSAAQFIARFTDAEYLAMLVKRKNDVNANVLGSAKNWDFTTFNGFIDLNLQTTVDLKTSLVTDGVLTAARADEIFGDV